HINNAVTKARSKTLDLVQNDFAHIPGRAVRHVAVSPAGVFTVRGAAVIKEALLGNQHIRILRMLSAACLAFGGCNLFEGSTHMHGSGSATAFILPGNSFAEGQINFEDAAPVFIIPE